MSKKNKNQNNNHQQTDEYGQIEGMSTMNVASDTECTGIIPTPPQNCDEDDAYSDIYDIPAETSDGKSHSQGKSKKSR